MTRGQAVAAAREIDRRCLGQGSSWRDPRGIAYGHLRWMVVQMSGGMSENKTMRWLGYIQGVLVARGMASLDDMKEISRKASHE